MPQRLGRYAVQRRIGAGGFATVWAARDEELDSLVAVKVLAENWSENSHIRRRFLEEGRFLRRVDSPHVVAGYDAGELEDGRPYLVMAYADRGTLAELLDRGGLAPEQAVQVIAQVGAGLQALHDRDIVHRDLKPANVLFRSIDGVGDPDEGDQAPLDLTRVRALVGDLGLGKAVDASTRLTMVGGTPTYIAPEQARAETPDARADQYSLAVLSYVLLTGRPPYDLSSLGAAADPGPPPALSTDGRSFPAAVEAVVRRGLARDREERFTSVAEYVAALTAAVSGAAADVLPTAPPAPIGPGVPAPTGDRAAASGSTATDPAGGVRLPAVVVVALAVLAVAGIGYFMFSEIRGAARGQQPATGSGQVAYRCWDGVVRAELDRCGQPDASAEAAAWVFGVDDVGDCTVAGSRAEQGRVRSWWCDTEIDGERVELHYSRWESDAAAGAVYREQPGVQESTIRTGWQQFLMPAQGGRAKAAVVYAEAPWSVTVYAPDEATRDVALQDLLRRMKAEQDLPGTLAE